MPPHGPNSQGGRRGGGHSSGRRGGRGGGGRGGGGGGRGEQRWWDPVWRAERLRQQQAEMEVLDENEWWNKIEQWKTGGEQEMLIKRNFSRGDQQTLSDMALQMGLYFHAYNKGKALVVSKVPLPDYRADLDERHGSTQKEIKMSTETERKLGSLLKTTQESGSSGASASAFNDQQDRTSTLGLKRPDSASKLPDSLEKEKFSFALKERQEKLKATESVKALKAFREKLPAFKMKEEFLNSVSQNQVLVVSGETGCGKTTQLPQFILEEEISSLRGADCNIICTQPRRISAISVASRISAERGESIGESVGYQIRLESKRSDQTRLLFCTTGVLLRRLIEDPNLTNVSHLLVDEIHERGMNEDFLLIILRDLLPRRPDLRLILMSATINADMFSTYFGNSPTMHIPGFTFPVAELFLEDVLEKSRYNIKSSDSGNYQGSSRGRRRESESKKDDLTTLFEDIDINSHYKSYSSATRNSLEAWSGAQIDVDLVEATIEHICRLEGGGAILVFLTGWDEISKLLEKINMNNFLGDSSKFLVLPLHGSMPTVNQREIFDRPPPNKRKIVLATNIAESSITIDDVVYVVDCGKAKETSYDALNKVACLLPSWISKASAHQRRGRAGRVQAGVCYRLYPKVIYDAFPQYQLPEIIRTPLQELCLHIKSLQVGSIGSFLAKALQPPDALAVENAIELLKTIGALNDVEELTPLGRHLCTLPVDPNIGKMLLIGAIFQCVNPALTIAAALAYRSPFVLPLNRKEEADEAKRYFAGDSCSDHIALLKAYEGYRDAKRGGNEKDFCWQNFLSPVTLRMMEDMRNQFLDLLSDIGFVDKSKPNAYNQYSYDMEMISAVLCAGLYPNVVQCKRRGKRTAFYTKELGKVDIHPGSVNARVNLFSLPYLVYSEKVKTTSVYIRDSTNISDYALLMFGGNLIPSKTGEGIEMLGGYLHFCLFDLKNSYVSKLFSLLRFPKRLFPKGFKEVMNTNPVTNGFVKPVPTEEEQAKIEEVRKLLGPLPEKLSSFCSDDAVLRYLRARNWHVKKATKMLKETLKWRVQYKPEEICWEEVAGEAETGKIYRSSCVDKLGRPVLIMRPSVENSKSVKGQIRYLVYCMENAVQNLPPGEEQMVWMIDFHGYSLANVSLRTTKETAHVLQEHYPERLAFAVLYNPPKFFEPFWKVARPFLEPKTRNKVKFVYSDDPNTKVIMEENFDMEKMELAFGGNDDSGFNIEKHSERMKEDDKKRLASLEGIVSASLDSLSILSVSDGTASNSAHPSSHDVSEDEH